MNNRWIDNNKKDIFLIIILIAVGLVSLGVMLLGKTAGKAVRVTVDGKISETYSLMTDGSYEIAGYGNGINILEIKAGRACMKHASCPDGLCVKMGYIRDEGQSVICLPNRVVAEVVGDNGYFDNTDDEKPDAVVR